jgi:hypothetical protein
MIYAIEADRFIKFGRAANVGKRLAELETGCPFDLTILAAADWPNGAETAIHRLLANHRQRGEWFKDCPEARQIIGWMLNKDVGLARLQAESLKHGKPTWRYSKGWIRTEKQDRLKEQKQPAQPLALAHARASNLADDIVQAKIARRQAERMTWWESNSPALHQ